MSKKKPHSEAEPQRDADAPSNTSDTPPEPSEAHVEYQQREQSANQDSAPTGDASPASVAFDVVLHASTPLKHNPYRTEQATTPDEAWAEFCRVNGIAGSKCERTITRVE